MGMKLNNIKLFHETNYQEYRRIIKHILRNEKGRMRTESIKEYIH